MASCEEHGLESGDWKCCEEEEEDGIDKNWACCEDEERHCFHKFEEHLKNVRMLSGGDYFKTDVCPNNFGGNTELANCDLSTLLNIGAEAEKRREDEFQKMMCNLEQVAKNNKLLHYDIRRKNAIIDSLKSQIDENNAIICNLKSEINKFKQKYIEAKNCNNYLYSMQPEIESMKAENNRLEQELEQLTWEYCEFQKSHSECPTEQENQNRINTINHFKNLIADAKKQIDASKQKINCLTETNEKLQKRICFISNEMKQICQKQVEKIKSYDDIICKLQIQLKKLNNELLKTRAELKEKNVMHEKLKCLMKNVINQNNDQQCQKVEELQEVIHKQANDIKYLEEVNSITTSKLENECEVLDEIITRQNKQIDNMANEVKCRYEEDVESVGILNDVTQLNCDITISQNDPRVMDNDPCSVLKRIIKVRSRVQSKLQREQFKYEKSKNDLCYLRCQFARLQTDIETFRSSDKVDYKDEIKIRICKEQELSKAIMKNESDAEYAKMKVISLQKTLKNIDKIREVVQHINP